jgi:hypothetical protein
LAIAIICGFRRWARTFAGASFRVQSDASHTRGRHVDGVISGSNHEQHHRAMIAGRPRRQCGGERRPVESETIAHALARQRPVLEHRP